MFVGRKSELARLNESYEKSGIPVVILYGREGIGKTTLIQKFCEDKNSVFYEARELSKKEQAIYFDSVLLQVNNEIQAGRKTCLVIDEFDLMQKANKEFFSELDEKLDQNSWEGNLLLVLISSSIQWVENQMVDGMGSFASRIDSFIKLKEFTFLEMVNRFEQCSTQECISIYGILGGVPQYLDYWDVKKGIKENIIQLILQQSGPLRREASRFLKTSLRELPYYNTILSVLAEDEPKLNYLYKRTEFSRAKISVYIRNLIQIDVAEKYFSFEPKKHDRAMKGLYGISDCFIHFWYKFIFPNLTSLNFEEPEVFYDRYIKDELPMFIEKTYENVCREFLVLMNEFNKLPVRIEQPEVFYGKDGRIPVIAHGDQNRLLVGQCKWSIEPMGREEFQNLITLTEQTGQDADCYYLFSKGGFTNELEVMASGMDNIELVDLESL